jgi:hypothetical protein
MPVKKMKAVEIANGRAAMIGCSAIGMSALVLKSNLIESLLSQNLQSIWWVLGIYSS